MEHSSVLKVRYDDGLCPSGYTYNSADGYCHLSSWYLWGRWVLAGGVALIVILLSVCAIFARRQRRRRAMNNMQQPYYQGYSQPLPAYPNEQQLPNTGKNFNPNEGYHGNPQNGNVPPPPSSYQPTGGYAPPSGSPPSK